MQVAADLVQAFKTTISKASSQQTVLIIFAVPGSHHSYDYYCDVGHLSPPPSSHPFVAIVTNVV